MDEYLNVIENYTYDDFDQNVFLDYVREKFVELSKLSNDRYAELISDIEDKDEEINTLKTGLNTKDEEIRELKDKYVKAFFTESDNKSVNKTVNTIEDLFFN